MTKYLPYCLIFIVFLNKFTNSLVSVCDQCICEEKTREEDQFPIQIVDCNGRNLNTLPDTADGEKFPKDTNYLDMSFNNIQSLDQYNYEFALDNLQVLNLSHNEIKEINENFFNYVISLVELDLSYNKLSSLESIQKDFVLNQLIQLRKLDLSHNSLKTLPHDSFERFKNLQFLDISYNPFQDDFINKAKLFTEELSLSKNITNLICEKVGFTQLTGHFLDGYNNLTTLSLADNKLEYIPSLPKSLEELDLSGNYMTVLTVHYLSYGNIKHLKLNRLQNLIKIDHYAFHDLKSLQHLELNDCTNLEEFNSLAFGLLSKPVHHNIKQISLARNGLKTLNETYKYLFDDANIVDLSFNPFECNCDILWLQEYKHFFINNESIRFVSIILSLSVLQTLL